MDLERLLGLSTTHVCDIAPSVRRLNPYIQPVFRPIRMVGIARIVITIKAIDAAKEEEVIVARSESEEAVAGELFSQAAITKKLAGIVIDGYSRDFNECSQLKLPFLSRLVHH